MAYRLFHDFFPDLAERETRTVTVLPGADIGIPAGEYNLLEMFCDEAGCDCRRVLFSVLSSSSNAVDAVINWGWEDIEFYSRWMKHGSREDAEYLKGPSLNVGSPAADHAPAILALVHEILLADKPFAQRVQRHYDLFRNRVDGGSSTDFQKPESPAPNTYNNPVNGLLKLGEPNATVDYAALGLRQEHVPALIQMATDMALHHAAADSDLVWAPVHAWRALGELGDEAAVEPLVNLLRLVDEDDDWVNEDLPVTLGEFGAAAVPPLTVFLEDNTRGLWARVAAIKSLAEIARRHPDTRDTCAGVLTNKLKRFTENDPSLNAFLITALVDLDALESAHTMEEAFAADAVDLSVMGDWEDVQIELGLLDKRATPRPAWEWLGARTPAFRAKSPQSLGKTHAKTKKKRKEQKKSRKKNRRK